MAQKLQKNRFERKYTIEEAKAQAIRTFVMSYLAPDPFNKPELPGYIIHSLYLDNSALQLARDTLDAVKNRFKLRIRFYDEEPDSPCFFEIKRRITDIVTKQRAMVSKQTAARILAGHWPTRRDCLKPGPDHWGALQQFCVYKHHLQADGTAYVTYQREAFISPTDESVRVTFDRNMIAGTYNHRDLTIEEPRIPTQIRMPDGKPGVVLELKFVNRFPNWMRTLAHEFQLKRVAMPKYVKCVTALRRNQNVAVKGILGKEYDT